jgi:hypothetical protein
MADQHDETCAPTPRARGERLVTDARDETADRLARIEGALAEVLRELRARKRRSSKRAKSVGESAAMAAANDTKYAPTELDKAAARRALRRYR